MRYEPDFRSTRRWLQTSPELQAVCILAAEDIAATARVIAPVSTGAYRDSIHVENDAPPGTVDDGRVAAAAVADDRAAAPLEFGNQRARRARHPLRQAAELTGYDLADD